MVNFTHSVPSGCLERKPSRRSVKFLGHYICLTALSRQQNMDLGYLSRIFSGKRDIYQMTLREAIKISASFGISVDALIEGLEQRMKEIERGYLEVQMQHDARIRSEWRKDKRHIKEGKIPVPRISFEKV